MELGWIDFSKSERSKILSVLDLLGEKGVLDEFGISQIRDSYFDLFFMEHHQSRLDPNIFSLFLNKNSIN